MSDPQPLLPIPPPQEPPPAEAAALEDRTQIEQLMAIARQSGPIFLLPVPGPRSVAVWSQALVNEICDDARFDKMLGAGLVALRQFVGDGLFTAYTDEPNWHKAHNILLPNFSQQAMHGYHPQMLDLATQLVEKWARLNPGETIEVPHDTTSLTLDTIGLCGFGYRFNSFYRSEPHFFVENMIYTLERAMDFRVQLDPSLLANDPEVERRRVEMDAFLDEIIAARKADPVAAAETNDLLGCMLNGVDKATGEKLDDLTIRYNINTFLVAGHETTSGLISFAIAYLLQHPAVVAKGQAEVDRVLGADPRALPTYDQVRSLAYVSQILKEALRLWPTAPLFTRHPFETTVIGGAYQIEPDDLLRVVIPMLHRDPAIWGPDPEAFDPDRFAPEREDALPPNAYKPFGSGQRACIGRQFALHEATLVLGMILHRFDLVATDDYQLRIKQTLTIKPEGLAIRVRPRVPRATETPHARRQTPEPARPPDAAPVRSSPQPPITPSSAHGTPLLILFGSNLGSAEDLAHKIANEAAARGYQTATAPLDDRAGALPTEGAVVVVTASYNGTPPDNAAKFCAWLRSPDLAANALAGVRYAVFGCGNREWSATFQAIPRLIDGELAAHGAERVYERGEGDAAGAFDDQAASWVGGLWDALAAVFGLAAAEPVVAARPLYAVERVSAPANPFALVDGVRPMTIAVNRELQGSGAERSTRHLEVVLPADVDYRTGDHLGVFPRNPPELVMRVLRRFGFAGDAYVRITRHGAGTPVIPLDQPIAILDLLSRYLDLQEVASRQQVAGLADRTECPPDKAALTELADGRFAAEVFAKRVSILDLLERFPACELSFADYLEMVHPLRVRYYSIASSPLVEPKACSLTVAVVDADARSGNGRYQGVGSTYLARHGAESVVDAYVRAPNLPFRPPDDPATPIVMVGPGTGVAPFRGFLQERAALLARGQKLGEALLFFGCRNADHDFLYRDELETFAAHGIVTLVTAFSRPTDGTAKCYVQDRIRERGDEVWRLLEAGAVVFVCGDGGRMEPAVRQTLIDLYAEQSDATPEAAAAWHAEQVAAGRYLADVWAQG